MRKLFACLALALTAASAQGAVVINEIRADNASTDINEYFELSGNPGESLAGLTYIVLGDGAGASGTIEAVIALGGTIPGDGYFLASENTNTLGGTVDLDLLATGLNFENDDTYTHMLVTGFSGALNVDVDTNNDGILDSTPWTSIVDSVAFLSGIDASAELPYSATQVGPDPIKGTPWHLYRNPNGTGPWSFDSLDNGSPTAGTDPANYLTDTPGAANIPEPATLTLLAFGAVAMLRRRR